MDLRPRILQMRYHSCLTFLTDSRRKGKKPPPSAGRNKFLIPQHPWITGVIPVWAEALAKVDQKRPSPVSGDV